MKKMFGSKTISAMLLTAVCAAAVPVSGIAQEQNVVYDGMETVYYEEFDGASIPTGVTSVNSQEDKPELVLATEDDEKAGDGKAITCKATGIYAGMATVTIPFENGIKTAESKIEVTARIKPIYLYGTTASTEQEQKYFYERFFRINGKSNGVTSEMYSIYDASWNKAIYSIPDWKGLNTNLYSVLWGKDEPTDAFSENTEYVTYKYVIDAKTKKCTISYSNDGKNYTEMFNRDNLDIPEILTSMSMGSTLGMSYAIDYVKVRKSDAVYYEGFDGASVPTGITSSVKSAGRQSLTLAIETDEKAGDGKAMTCRDPESENAVYDTGATVTIPFGEVKPAEGKIEITARIKPIYLHGTTASTSAAQKYYYTRFFGINGINGTEISNLYGIYNASWEGNVWLLDWKTNTSKYYPILWGKENTSAVFPENPDYVTYKYTIDAQNNECIISYSKDGMNYIDMFKYTPSAMPQMLTSMSIGSTLGTSYAIDYIEVNQEKAEKLIPLKLSDDKASVIWDTEISAEKDSDIYIAMYNGNELINVVSYNAKAAESVSLENRTVLLSGGTTLVKMFVWDKNLTSLDTVEPLEIN